MNPGIDQEDMWCVTGHWSVRLAHPPQAENDGILEINSPMLNVVNIACKILIRLTDRDKLLHSYYLA
jgi:hypothetical protein